MGGVRIGVALQAGIEISRCASEEVWPSASQCHFYEIVFHCVLFMCFILPPLHSFTLASL